MLQWLAKRDDGVARLRLAAGHLGEQRLLGEVGLRIHHRQSEAVGRGVRPQVPRERETGETGARG